MKLKDGADDANSVAGNIRANSLRDATLAKIAGASATNTSPKAEHHPE